MRKITLTLFFIFISITALSQYKYRDSNRIGISFGVNQFTLNTIISKQNLIWVGMRGFLCEEISIIIGTWSITFNLARIIFLLQQTL